MKVISIDFDIFLHQDLMIYNDVIRLGWHNLLTNPLMQSLRINTNLFSILTLWLMEQSKKINQKQIFFIKDHQSVNPILENFKEYDIYNIDFHHDLGYGPNPSEEPLNCGNWVFKLLETGKLKSYTWLNAKESLPPYNNIDFKNCKYNEIDIIINNFKLRELEDADIIIICLSPEWVPPQYQNLFYLWMDLLSNHYGEKFKLY